MLKYVNENPSIHNNRIKYLGLKFLQVVKRDKNLLHSTFAIDRNLLGVDLFVQTSLSIATVLEKKFLLLSNQNTDSSISCKTYNTVFTINNI